jgi:NADH-quinone oxidoreductase subunit N
VNFHDILLNFYTDLGGSLTALRPELALCVTILALVLVRMILPGYKAGAYYVMLLGAAAALWLALPGGRMSGVESTPTFTGMLVVDSFSVSLRILLLLFALMFVGFTRASGVPNSDNATEFYVLTAGATLGMCLMVSANHALIVLLGIEMASVPSYVLAGILRQRRESSEAALKYAVFGAGTAGVMLYGISLLTGMLGSAHLPTMAVRLAHWLHENGGADHRVLLAVLILGGLMWMVGLAFKLSAVPFHFWAPDVFEGAPAEVGTFLSIASKAAALGLLARLAIMFSANIDAQVTADLAGPRLFLGGTIALLAAVTCTFGNLAAYGQTNMKRLLAYSTIAHAGYMMMAVAAAVVVAGTSLGKMQDALAALVVYLAVYLFMNFGAFAIVAFLRNAIGSESIADYAGLGRRSPGLAVAMAILLFSLVGLPPLAGFSAKFVVFASLWDSGLIALLVIGGLNTVLSLFYYLRVVKVMVLASDSDGRPAPEVRLVSVPGMYGAAFAAMMLVLFLWWGGLWNIGQAAAKGLVPDQTQSRSESPTLRKTHDRQIHE